LEKTRRIRRKYGNRKKAFRTLIRPNVTDDGMDKKREKRRRWKALKNTQHLREKYRRKRRREKKRMGTLFFRGGGRPRGIPFMIKRKVLFRLIESRLLKGGQEVGKRREGREKSLAYRKLQSSTKPKENPDEAIEKVRKMTRGGG